MKKELFKKIRLKTMRNQGLGSFPHLRLDHKTAWVLGVRSLYEWARCLWGKQSNMWCAHPIIKDEKVQEHWGLELDVYWHLNNYCYKIIEVKKQTQYSSNNNQLLA